MSFDLDTAAIAAVWESRWPGCKPVGFELRGCARDRWVRFHSLPESKRYPDDEREYAILLERHFAVLDDLGATGELLVIDCTFEVPDQPSAAPPYPSMRRWSQVELSYDERTPDFEEHVGVWIGTVPYSEVEIAPLLRAAADDQTAGLILAPHDLSWLYHPYDGGADVIARAPDERDALKAKYSSWLSSHPKGL